MRKRQRKVECPVRMYQTGGVEVKIKGPGQVIGDSGSSKSFKAL